MKDEQARVVFNLEVAQDFYQARLLAPHIAAEVVPGQFVEVQVGRQVSPFLRLPLSICNRDLDQGMVDLLYEDMGPKSHVLSRLQPGSEIACLGPLGHGFKGPTIDHNVLMVGGGIGTPPLLFLGEELRRSGHQVRLLVGARAAAKHLPDTLLNPAAQVVLKATDDGSLGHCGLVTDLLRQELEKTERCSIYTCGPHAMMAAVAGVCQDFDVPCQASLEEYMACGFGVCVGCVVEVMPAADGTLASPYTQYSRVCVDGPVFDARRVCW
jgi:dihydroorotate dehydrogenase electron transfer subunit